MVVTSCDAFTYEHVLMKTKTVSMGIGVVFKE